MVPTVHHFFAVPERPSIFASFLTQNASHIDRIKEGPIKNGKNTSRSNCVPLYLPSIPTNEFGRINKARWPADASIRSPHKYEAISKTGGCRFSKRNKIVVAMGDLEYTAEAVDIPHLLWYRRDISFSRSGQKQQPLKKSLREKEKK